MTGRRRAALASVPALFLALVLVPGVASAQAVPPPPAPQQPEPSIEELEEDMIPTLVLPEFRVRVGGGVGLQTSGGDNVFGRVAEEFEWLPSDLEFLLFGVGAAQMFSGRHALVQVGARAGAYATFCEDSTVRCQGAITLQLGVMTGGLGTHFDVSADADLRFLFVRLIELFVRGGFTSIGSTATFANITGGIGIAF